MATGTPEPQLEHHRACHDRRNFRHPCQLKKLRLALALLPDVGRHERQQKQRCTDRRVWTIFIASCVIWLVAMFILADIFLKKKDVWA